MLWKAAYVLHAVEIEYGQFTILVHVLIKSGKLVRDGEVEKELDQLMPQLLLAKNVHTHRQDPLHDDNEDVAENPGSVPTTVQNHVIEELPQFQSIFRAS